MIVPVPTGFGQRTITLADLVQHPNDWPLAAHHHLRVVSWSMFPTLLKGDRLTVGPAKSFGMGDLLVYSWAGALCCHRVIGQGSEGQWLLRGDAAQGAPHPIPAELIFGKVHLVMRGRGSFTPGAPPLPRAHEVCVRWIDERWTQLYERGRSFLRSLLSRLFKPPRVQAFLCRHIAVHKGRHPSTLEARFGPIVLATLHRPTHRLITRSWAGHLPFDTWFKT